jgi:NADPH2:quinone reductase
MSNSTTMHAVVLSAYETAASLRDVPSPLPAPGQVLVRIKASGVNLIDTKIIAGKAAHAQPVLPAILGIDLAGVVENAGAGVTGFRRGRLVSKLSYKKFAIAAALDVSPIS